MNPDEVVRVVAAMRTDLVAKKMILRHLAHEGMPEDKFAAAERLLADAIGELNLAITWLNSQPK